MTTPKNALSDLDGYRKASSSLLLGLGKTLNGQCWATRHAEAWTTGMGACARARDIVSWLCFSVKPAHDSYPSRRWGRATTRAEVAVQAHRSTMGTSVDCSSSPWYEYCTVPDRTQGKHSCGTLQPTTTPYDKSTPD